MKETKNTKIGFFPCIHGHAALSSGFAKCEFFSERKNFFKMLLYPKKMCDTINLENNMVFFPITGSARGARLRSEYVSAKGSIGQDLKGDQI